MKIKYNDIVLVTDKNHFHYGMIGRVKSFQVSPDFLSNALEEVADLEIDCTGVIICATTKEVTYVGRIQPEDEQEEIIQAIISNKSKFTKWSNIKTANELRNCFYESDQQREEIKSRLLK
jgi:hypothetical protein